MGGGKKMIVSKRFKINFTWTFRVISVSWVLFVAYQSRLFSEITALGWYLLFFLFLFLNFIPYVFLREKKLEFEKQSNLSINLGTEVEENQDLKSSYEFSFGFKKALFLTLILLPAVFFGSSFAKEFVTQKLKENTLGNLSSIDQQLFYAIVNKNTSLAADVIHQGADLNQNFMGGHPLYLAVNYNDMPMCCLTR